MMMIDVKGLRELVRLSRARHLPNASGGPCGEVAALADAVEMLLDERRDIRRDLERALRTPGDPETGPDPEQSSYPVYEAHARLQNYHALSQGALRALAHASDRCTCGHACPSDEQRHNGDVCVHSVECQRQLDAVARARDVLARRT